jgi:hypothetical protein
MSDQWAVGPMGCRTNGLSDHWVVGPMGCRTNGLSDQWAVGPMGCRTKGPSDQWTVGPMGCRTNGLSEYRAVPLQTVDRPCCIGENTTRSSGTSRCLLHPSHHCHHRRGCNAPSALEYKRTQALLKQVVDT